MFEDKLLAELDLYSYEAWAVGSVAFFPKKIMWVLSFMMNVTLISP